MAEDLEQRFRSIAPKVDFWSLRFVEERSEDVSVRRGVVLPPHTSVDSGVMVTVVDSGGMGYAATCDLTVPGLRRAAEQAREWAHRTASHALLDAAMLPRRPTRSHGTRTVDS